MPKGLVPIAPLRRGLFVLGGDGKMKRWERWKGEKVKRWKGEKMASPFKGGKMEGWKDGKGERVKRWERWKIERVLDNEQFGLNTNGA